MSGASGTAGKSGPAPVTPGAGGKAGSASRPFRKAGASGAEARAAPHPGRRAGSLGLAGRVFWEWVEARVDRWAFLGRTFILGIESVAFRAHRTRRRFIWSRILGEARLCLTNSAFFASVLGIMAGFLWTVIWFGVLKNIGGTDTLVKLAMTVQLSEVSPFLTAMVVTTAYTGPSATRLARIRLSGGLETLMLMGIPPAHILIWPRFLGQLIAFPCLLVFHCAFTVMGVGLGSRVFASYPLQDFMNVLVSGIEAYSFFRMAIQSVLMSCCLSFFAMHMPYNAHAVEGVEVPDLVRSGSLQGLFWASLAGIMVSVLYA
jgi:ABC-type transporter Mla maintaining outer membrane lipid asymmetry permease subunit MlaE